MPPTAAKATPKPPKVALYAHPACNDFVFNIPFALLQTEYQGRTLFDLSICSLNGENVYTQFGAVIPVQGDLSLLEQAEVVVIAGWQMGEIPHADLLNALKQADGRGAKIIALCYGTYVAAYAGILQGKNATTHWLAADDFQQRFPNILLDNNRLYIEDGNILTSAGASGGLDCLLYWIRQIYGAHIANDLARLLVAPPHREGGPAQFIRKPLAERTGDSKINTLLDFLRENLAQTHRLDDLAERLNLSRRTFSRHFKQATGLTLGDWLLQERLCQAQDLLQDSDDSIERIAEKSGFGTASNLRGQFKAQFHTSPNAWRKTFRSGE